MTVRNRFTFAEGLMVLAFAYAAKGYHGASIYTALASLLYTISINGFSTVRKDGIILVLIGIVEAVIIRMMHLEAVMPALAVNAITATISADIWMDRYAGKLTDQVRFTAAAYMVFLLMTLMIPDPVWGIGGTVLMVSMLFAPYLVLYAICTITAAVPKTVLH